MLKVRCVLDTCICILALSFFSLQKRNLSLQCFSFSIRNMKVAKVSSVYEGKIVNRGVGGEEGGEADRSRIARQEAQARRRNSRISLGPYSRPRSRTIKQRNIIIRSMASSSLNKEKEKEMEKENLDVNKVREKEKVEEVIMVDEKEEKEEKTKTETETADAAPTGPVGDWMFVGTDDWPLTWSYAEEWLWGGESLGLWLTNPHWEYINGVGWIENRES